MADSVYERDDGTRNFEHALAWIFAVIALGAATLGLLVGFDVVDLNIRDEGAAVAVEGVGQAETGAVTDAESYFRDALLWMIPAASAGMLAIALHRTEHHRGRRRNEVAGRSEAGMFNAEHLLAYVGVLAAVVAGALCLLVGYDAFDNGNTVEDGYLWGLASFVTAAVSVALHSVRHHQLEVEEETIVRIIEERTGGTATAPRERIVERRSDPLR